MRRARLLQTGVAVVLAGGALAAFRAARVVERRLAAEVERAGAPLGLTAGRVRFGWWGPVRLEDVRLAGSGPQAATAEAVEVAWGLAGGRDPRSHVRSVRVCGLRAAPGGLSVEWPEASFSVVEWTRDEGRDRVRLRQAGSGGTVEGDWSAAARSGTLALAGLDLSAARVSWKGEPVLDPGRWSGRLTLRRQGERMESAGDLAGEGVRVALPRALGLGSGAYGAPTAAALGWDLWRERDAIEVRRASARLAGLELDGHGRLGGPGARDMDLELSGRSDLGAAFGTTGLVLPASLPALPPARLGEVTFAVAAHGPPGDPAALRVEPRLQFAPAPEAVRAFQFLRAPFRYVPDDAPGQAIQVGPGAPSFIALEEVPPLFVRALLISEDAGFFGHPGIDVAEIPVAWAENEERGTSARGASTITQQLVKNLFLSRDKSYGRKLTEAALALMVDAAVPKSRLLEIYLNVIEWGPGLHGLGPAADHYFGKAPPALTVKEMAFLICLIPSPVRYHQAHLAGHPGPGMDLLMANLLAKLHSVGALSDAEYDDAMEEELAFAPEG